MSVTDIATWLNALVGIGKREYKQGTISRICRVRDFDRFYHIYKEMQFM